MKNKHVMITLPMEQVKWFKKRHTKISAYIQEKIREDMKNDPKV